MNIDSPPVAIQRLQVWLTPEDPTESLADAQARAEELGHTVIEVDTALRRFLVIDNRSG